MQQFFFKSLSSPLTGIDNVLGAMSRAPGEAEMVGTQELIFIALGLVCTIVSWIKLRPAYSVWMTGNWLLFVSVSFVLSVPRYTLTMFPILHPVFDARIAARLARRDYGLVNSLPVVLCERLRLGTMGVLKNRSQKSEVRIQNSDDSSSGHRSRIKSSDFQILTSEF